VALLSFGDTDLRRIIAANLRGTFSSLVPTGETCRSPLKRGFVANGTIG